MSRLLKLAALAGLAWGLSLSQAQAGGCDSCNQGCTEPCAKKGFSLSFLHKKESCDTCEAKEEAKPEKKEIDPCDPSYKRGLLESVILRHKCDTCSACEAPKVEKACAAPKVESCDDGCKKGGLLDHLFAKKSWGHSAPACEGCSGSATLAPAAAAPATPAPANSAIKPVPAPAK